LGEHGPASDGSDPASVYGPRMRSIRLIEPAAPLEERDLPDPRPMPDEVVVEIRAAGICHSDAHYRAGRGRVALPRTLGHEIAGLVIETGPGVTNLSVGDRVAVHYLVSCGTCVECARGGEQFCLRGEMFGKERDGGFAERIAVQARNAVLIPPEIPLDTAAVMMCSTATVYHALRLASLRPDESVAIIGFGGLGVSALQCARALGARSVAAIEVVPEKLQAAAVLGAIPIDGRCDDLAVELKRAAGGRGVDVVLDLVGAATPRLAALQSLAPGGRLLLVALGPQPFTFDPYADLLTRERRIIGCSDHLLSELPELMDLARRGDIDPSSAITRRVPLDAPAINQVLDDLDRGTSHLRTVVTR
jgi:D-arabinose 1-dehydrogenase-like Zn-dependent alcohol dehydrogenase